MSCHRCGKRTDKRLCRDCALDEQFAESRSDSSQKHFECPRCGGLSSGKDVVCFRCRSEEDDQ